MKCGNNVVVFVVFIVIAAAVKAQRGDPAEYGNAEGIWEVYAYASKNPDCAGERIAANMAYFEDDSTHSVLFSNLAPAEDNVFPPVSSPKSPSKQFKHHYIALCRNR